MNYKEFDKLFRDDKFPDIENQKNGSKFLKIRSISRSSTIELFCSQNNISLDGISKRVYANYLFDDIDVNEKKIDEFISEQYLIERNERKKNEDVLVDNLSRLKHFDWGGSFGNSLEKNIVNNYVKKIQSYDKINEEIESSLLHSLKGYTLNSWYNHWTSIVIEDIFKDHPLVLPTIGLIKKIDFFIDGIPFDLKVTYFPEQLMQYCIKQKGFGVELTRIKKVCRELNILIPSDLNPKDLKYHLLDKLDENHTNYAKSFLHELNSIKSEIIKENVNNPKHLKVWFYENQGEARFDASNRFFLVLTDSANLNNSWRLKRSISLLRDKINSHLDNLQLDKSDLETTFYWKKTDQHYKCKSDILFINI